MGREGGRKGGKEGGRLREGGRGREGRGLFHIVATWTAHT